jgi:hypothetical protein
MRCGGEKVRLTSELVFREMIATIPNDPRLSIVWDPDGFDRSVSGSSVQFHVST